MNKILIIGGAGFIGSMTNKILINNGYETIVLDNLSRGDRSTVSGGAFIKGDLGDETLLNSLFSKHSFSAVIHLAAFTDVGESVKNPGKYYVNNVSKTLILLDKMVEYGVENFIFSSSAAVYGTPLFLPISEDHPKKPINPYGHTKLIIEDCLHNVPLRYTCLRYFNAAGGDPTGEIKTEKLRATNLIPLAFNALKNKNHSFTINGDDYNTRDGTCLRDYIHIYDLAQAHLLAMERLLQGGSSDVYNLGNGNGFTIREVLECIEKITKKKLEITIGPRRTGDPAALVANADKAKMELNWRPKYTELESIIMHGWQSCKPGLLPNRVIII